MRSETISISRWRGIGKYDFIYGLPEWAQAIAEEHSRFFHGIDSNTLDRHYYLVFSTEILMLQAAPR